MTTKRMRRLGSTLPSLAASLANYGAWGRVPKPTTAAADRALCTQTAPRLVQRKGEARLWQF
jgi:hypothetical protein